MFLSDYTTALRTFTFEFNFIHVHQKLNGFCRSKAQNVPHFPTSKKKLWSDWVTHLAYIQISAQWITHDQISSGIMKIAHWVDQKNAADKPFLPQFYQSVYQPSSRICFATTRVKHLWLIWQIELLNIWSTGQYSRIRYWSQVFGNASIEFNQRSAISNTLVKKKKSSIW